MSNPLDSIPAMPAPVGQVSNLIDPPSKAGTVTTLDAIFVALMLTAVSARFFVRAKYLKNWAWDDVIKIGYGRHLWDIPVSWLLPVSNLQLMSANGITYPLTIFFAKLCILLLYVRIFSTISETFKVIVWVGIALLASFYLSMICVAIVSLVRCIGLQAQGTTFCQAYSGPIVLLNAAFNVATDIWILVLPIPLLSTLHLRARQKVGVVIVFGAGTAACATSIVRLVNFATNYRGTDVFWIQATNAMYTIAEINIAIIITCMFCFPTLYTHTKSSLKDTASNIRTLFNVSSQGSSGSYQGSWRGPAADLSAATEKKHTHSAEEHVPSMEFITVAPDGEFQTPRRTTDSQV
ncbi:hypothetical protein GQ53DRAFT_719376 [Thozetella sp. PMI_491]|nr:hypothetical protein GQ53DRAFT_719376 [Thozetella sp. PMI_491]